MNFLFVTNVSWARELGAASVLIELTAALRDLGHHVEKFSYEDAFPTTAIDDWIARRRGLGRSLSHFRNWRSFPARAHRFVRTHGTRFDVVDAGLADLPYRKSSLRFHGLLVARTPFLVPAYARFEAEAARRWPTAPSGSDYLRSLLGAPKRFRTMRHWPASCANADLINVSNSDDARELADLYGPARVERFVLGISEDRAAEFDAARRNPRERLQAQTVVFVGTWNARKGARDWPAIIMTLLRAKPTTRFLFLGTDLDPRAVLAEIPALAHPSVEVRTRFSAGDLPSLLGHCTVGAFPGYREGFGLAVLEKLAAGLPVVAYDAAGTRDMIRQTSLRGITPGDTERFAAVLAGVLDATPIQYGALCDTSRAVAGRYRWHAIARYTAESYRRRMEKIGAGAHST